ncbi:MAG: hypothetical protein ACTSW4_01320 [Candidatus Ranarchaeia archaeon]
MVTAATGDYIQETQGPPITAMEYLHQRLTGLLESNDYDPARIFYPAILPPSVAHRTVSALLAGNNIMYYGPPGTGKSLTCSVIRKNIFGFPERWVVAYPANGCNESLATPYTLPNGKVVSIKGVCPVGDHPASLYDKKFQEQNPPCPVCQIEYNNGVLEELGDLNVKPADSIFALKLRLHDGYGLKRIQCSPETTPEKLVGRINIQKYLHDAEICGVPSDPRVFDPGDLLQAFMFSHIDELCKLPIASQQVLLQATEEREINPSGIRMPFPRRGIDVATSNEEDMSRILKPLNDRFINIYFPYEEQDGIEENSRANINEILRLGLYGPKPDKVSPPDSIVVPIGSQYEGLPISRHAILPLYLEQAIIDIVRAYRTNEIWKKVRESGSHRVMIDTALNALGYAMLRTGTFYAIANLTDVHYGLTSAILGRIRGYENELEEYHKKMHATIDRINIPQFSSEHLKHYVCQFVFKVKGEKAKSAFEQLEPYVREPKTLEFCEDFRHVNRAALLKHIVSQDNDFIQYVLAHESLPPLPQKERLELATNLVASLLIDIFRAKILDSLCQ